MRRAVVLAIAAVVFAGTATGQPANLPDFIRPHLGMLFPKADRLGDVKGTPPAVRVFRTGKLIGYIFSTWSVTQSVGYSGKPIDVVVGLDLRGRITGGVLREHQEPILVIGVLEKDLRAFVARFRDHDIRKAIKIGGRNRETQRGIDGVSGATVSSVVIADAILRSARAVARPRGLLGRTVGPQLNVDLYERLRWPTLLRRGFVVRRRFSNRQVGAALAAAGAEPQPNLDPEATFITLYAGLLTPAMGGRNVLGDRTYNRLMGSQRPGTQIILIAADGLYSFKGTRWRRRGTFDRVQIRQNGRTIALTRAQHRRIDKMAAEGAREFREMAYFIVPAAERLDPTRPWQIELIVRRPHKKNADSEATVRFGLDYTPPSALILGISATRPSTVRTAVWAQVWRDRVPGISVLLAALAALTGILFFQGQIARRPKLYHTIRIGFLVFTLGWLGWWAGAQLSVVNVLTFTQSLISGFRWELFLLEPLIFILWCYVALAMLFWGRGVFCGWLCPFGALQELSNRIARYFQVPQLRIPWGLHERLWPLKYIIFMGLFAVSLGSAALAVGASEVEPFKTAIVLHFWRAWPYALYAAALLVVGLFVERFYCRYLCPLGAALALPARARMFEWLHRRRECGRPCQTCAAGCPVQSIHPEGRINPNECIHCLHCQVVYSDDMLCPPMIEQRKRSERLARTFRAAAERPL